MATLRKIIGENLDATQSFEFEVPRTFNLNYFTAEIKFLGADPLTYPASENDAQLSLEDDECGDGSSYEIINGGLTKIVGGSSKSKVRIVDLPTQNIRIKYEPFSANGGTIEKITITFRS